MEVWKEIKESKGCYQVSNYGNVRSFKNNKVYLMKQSINNTGYYALSLYLNNKVTNKKVHQLVAIAFLNHIACGYELVVNHIDFNKLNNKVENLEIVTSRVNSNRQHIKSTSQYTGVSIFKQKNKWRASIRLNKKTKHLGLFTNEYDAHLAYQKALKEITIKK